MSFDNQPSLNTPEGLNYECTGCGKCCSGWSVPMTEEDYERISAIDWGSLDPDLKDKKLFQPLSSLHKKNSPFTHAINANPEGQCPFLKNNLCFIHSQFGAQTKPAMCQLFPYSFNETPSGLYVSVSYVSRGAIFNAGKALSEQNEHLQKKYQEFQRLFPDHHPNWSSIKLSANMSLNWSTYLEIEKNLISIMQDKSISLESRFLQGSRYLNSLSAYKTQLDQTEKAQERLNYWDKVLLITLYKTYFPVQFERLQGYGNLMISMRSIFAQTVNVLFPDDLYKVVSLPWPLADVEMNEMLYRFFYSHIFAKLYFGAGFGQLSLTAGFNHLAVLLVLIKLHARALALSYPDSKIGQADIINTIVQLERSWGETKVTGMGAACLELLLSSPARVGRLLHFVS